MARLVWNVTTGSAAITEATSWKVEGTGAPGTAPGATDTLIWDGTAQGTATDGATPVDLTTGTVEVAQGYTGDMGTSGNPLRISCQQVRFGGQGTFYHTGTVSGSAPKVTQKNGRGNLWLRGTYNGALTLTRGNCVLQSAVGAQFSAVRIGYELNQASDVNFVLEAGSPAPTTVTVASGTARIRASVTNLVAQSNVFLEGGDGTTPVDISFLEIVGANVVANAQGTIASCEAVRGLLDFSGDPRPKTVTELNQYTGCVVNTKNGTGSINIPTWNAIGQVSTVIDGAAGASQPVQS